MFLYLVALIVLSGAAFFIWQNAPRLDDAPLATTTPEGTQMRVEQFYDESESYTIEAKYPQFGVASVDAAIKGHVDGAIAAFKQYPADVPSVDSVPKNELAVSFDDVYTGDDYVSVALVISEYTGGAHPNSVIVGVNVDLERGREATQGEALVLIGKSLAEVAREADATLSARLGEAYFAEGTKASAGNYATFLVGKDTVTFVFNNYQVAPYAAGPQEVSFDRVR